MCSVNLGRSSNSEYWKLDANLVKEAVSKKKRYLFTILEKATAKGMKSSAWQRFRNHLNALVNLRNHLVHEGLDGSEDLQRKLRKCVGSIDEIEGASLEDKVGRVAPIGQFIDVPQRFLDKMFDVLEQLAADLIVPNDHELPAPPSVAEVVELFTKIMH